MRNKLSPGFAVSVAALSLLVVAVLPEPAAAKGLLESIFGFLGSSPSSPALRAAPRPAYQPPQQFDHGGQINPFASRKAKPAPVGRSGGYRTVCVRLCDGYFFPISSSVSKRQLYDDARQCTSRCNSDARLYYMPPMTPSLAQARDLHGATYDTLSTAFLYRKKLVKNCTCRPEPWSVSERMRHKSYELVAQDAAAAPIAAVAEAETGANGNEKVVAASPQMIGEGAVAKPVVAVTSPAIWPPTPRAAVRPSTEKAANNKAQSRYVRPNPIKKNSWGLGAAINGLPKVKYRHSWAAGTN